MRTLTVLFVVAGLALGTARAQTDDARTNAITDRYLTSVSAELTSRIDTRNAAAGQEVDAKTRQTARLADGTELPEGTKLVGHIVNVQAQDQANGRTGSVLAITFDHAELKGGQTVRLRVVVQAVAPLKPLPPGQFANIGASSASMGQGMGAGAGGIGSGNGGIGSGSGGGMGAGGDMGTGSAGGTGGGMGTGSAGGSSGGGGQAGGMGQGAGGGGIGDAGPLARATGSLGRLPSSVGETASSNVGAATGPTGSPVIQAGETLSTAPRMTGLPGVWMSVAARSTASATLVAYDHNITLAAGTQLTLGVITR